MGQVYFLFYYLDMLPPKKIPKPKKTIKDLLNNNELVKGRAILDKKLAEEKVLAEAIEFERRNQKRKIS